MKQVIQNLRTGETSALDVPCPNVGPGQVLIETQTSLISAGTERMLVNFGQSNLVSKARQQPEKVRQVLDKMRTEGVLSTLEKVRNKLEEGMPLGYCNVGKVLAVGEGVEHVRVGQRVLSNGGHAEIVLVPKHLCAPIPENVDNNVAVFGVLGSIALNGIRLAKPTLGECFVVSGLGLIGLLTVQLLKAQGCRVLGLDFDEERLALAKEYGAETLNLGDVESPIEAAMEFSRGRGVDGVLVTAYSESREPMVQASHMCRKRGRIILVGVTKLEFDRDPLFKKEIRFQVSCSYGPGRYDTDYEQKGIDYPTGYVRWTEQRNFEAVLDMMADGKISTEAMITHRFPFEHANRAYDLLTGKEASLGIVLDYPAARESQPHLRDKTVQLELVPKRKRSDCPAIGVIGAGGYALSNLLPALKSERVELHTIASRGGRSAGEAAKRFGFSHASTDSNAVLENPDIQAVIIATPHHLHAPLVCEALRQGKHVFVEKPLAMHYDELDAIDAAYQQSCASEASPILMVGFNRRFAPHIQQIRHCLNQYDAPKHLVMTVNAGRLPADHWLRDRKKGGGRIIGEGCHFIDLMTALIPTDVTHLSALPLGGEDGSNGKDGASILLQFADGSLGTVHYIPNGHPRIPKERLEITVAGGVIQMDNYRQLDVIGIRGLKKDRRMRMDKGNHACMKAFVAAIREGRPAPIAYSELYQSARLTLQAFEAATGISLETQESES